jgi:hypothetical protein
MDDVEVTVEVIVEVGVDVAVDVVVVGVEVLVVTAVVPAPEVVVVVVIVVGVLVVGVVVKVVNVFAGDVTGVEDVIAVELGAELVIEAGGVLEVKQYCFTEVIICPMLSIFNARAEDANGIRAD